MLVALEEFNDIPFRIKRVYYMYDTVPGVVRGHHAHRALEQILICIHGSCKVRLDNGQEKKIVPLEKPYEGLYISHAMWREMYDFSEDAWYLHPRSMMRRTIFVTMMSSCGWYMGRIVYENRSCHTWASV